VSGGSKKLSISGNSCADTISGFLALVGVFVGTLLGFVLSKIQRRKERLIEGIYEPLLAQVGVTKDNIQDGMKMPDLGALDETMQSGWYLVMDDKVKKKADLVYQELKDYRAAYTPSGVTLNKIIEEEVKKVLAKIEKPERYKDVPYDVVYRAHIVGAHVGSANLRECLRIGKTPLQFLRETKPTVKDSEIDCLLGGFDIERRLVDPMAELALKKANEDSIVQETRALRNSLLGHLQELIKMLSEQVVG